MAAMIETHGLTKSYGGKRGIAGRRAAKKVGGSSISSR